MKRRVVYISVFFALVLMMLSCSAYATNVLVISEEDVVHGKSVTSMLQQIETDSFTIEEIQIGNGKSLTQIVNEMDTNGRTYDSVIIQLPYSSRGTVVDTTSAINTLYTRIGSTENTKYFIGTFVGKIGNYTQEIVTIQEELKEILDGLTTKNVASIPVYENLKKATDNSLDVYLNNQITTLGDLLVACTYSNSLGKNVKNLTSYSGLTDEEVKAIVEIANELAVPETETPSSEIVDETPTQKNETNNTIPSSSKKTSFSAPKKTSKVSEEKGNLKVVDSMPGYVSFKSDREPRLKYIVESDYLNIEIRDCGGVACEYPSGDGRYEAQKAMQPKIYHYDNDKRGAEVKNVKRPTESEYKKIEKEYVYTIGLPASEIGEEYTKFEIVAYDVKSKLKQQFTIDEVFMVKKSEDGKILVNRAPASYIVALKSSMNRIGILANDATGVSKMELRTVPKGKKKESDRITGSNGAIQNNWSAIKTVTDNKKYVKVGITKFEKIDALFKKSSWKGLNPKVSGEDGIYSVVITAKDASGASSIKTLLIDVRYYHFGETFKLTGNGTVKKADGKGTGRIPGDGSKGSSGGSGENSKNGILNGVILNGSKILKRGSKGDEVKKLQEFLNHLGYDLEEDGVYGPKTEAAVKDFQKKNDLDADGVVGAQTGPMIENKGKEASRSKKKAEFTKKKKGTMNTLEANPDFTKDSKKTDSGKKEDTGSKKELKTEFNPGKGAASKEEKKPVFKNLLNTIFKKIP